MAPVLDIGFTGTQYGMTEAQGEVLLSLLSHMKNQVKKSFPATPTRELVTIRLGDCIGADEQCYYLATHLSFHTQGHIPTNPKKRVYCSYDVEHLPKPYLARNRDIAMASRLLATPNSDTEYNRSGTWHTIRKARVLKRQIAIIFPNGRIQTEHWHPFSI